MAHFYNQPKRKRQTLRERVLAKVREQRLSSTHAQSDQSFSPDHAQASCMRTALAKLVDALRGRDWYDEPAEREVFIAIIKHEITTSTSEY